jgi:hypothetical protein
MSICKASASGLFSVADGTVMAIADGNVKGNGGSSQWRIVRNLMLVAV